LRPAEYPRQRQRSRAGNAPGTRSARHAGTGGRAEGDHGGYREHGSGNERQCMHTFARGGGRTGPRGMSGGTKRIRLLLVDDHAVVRAGYRLLLQNTPDIEIVAEAETGEQACRMYIEHNPDIVVMDLSLPGIGGLEAIRRIMARDREARILVFSMHENTMFVEQALAAGARGYITKSSAPKVLVDAVRQVAAGRSHLDSDLA